MANPQTWTDPTTGDTYELIPDTPEVKTWTDPSTGDTYELIPDTTSAPTKTAAPKTPKELPISEGLAAGYRTAKDEIPYVQTRRREEVYRDLAGKMGKNVVTDYFSPKALIPGREMFGIDSYDYDAVFNDAKKAGLVKDADRDTFEKTFLGREGDRNIDMNTVNQNPISGFIGGIGSMVADPLNVGAGIATGPASVGRSLLGKMGIEGGINAGIEALQLPLTNDALENLGQDMSAEEMAARVAMAGGFGAVLGGAGHFLRGQEPQANADGVRPWTEEEMSGITNLIDKGATVDDIAKAFPLTEEQKTTIQFYVDEKAKGNDTDVKFEDAAAEEPLPFEPPAFLEQPVKGPFKEAPDFLGVDIPKKGRAAPVKTAPEAEPVPNLAVNKQQAADHINNVLASDWKNAPRITAVDSLDELPPTVRQSIIDDGAEDAKGVTVDGEVYILSHNLKDIDDLSAVTYHEALGHAGLGMQFGKRLNAVLEQMYNTNEMVKAAADAWLAKNNTQSTNPVAHAVEEILAETSEGGKIDAKIMAKIKAFLKQYARRVPGLKNLKYTDKEVFAILSMAQNKVIKGGDKDVSGNGNRYIRAYHGSPKHGIRQLEPAKSDDPFAKDNQGIYLHPDKKFAEMWARSNTRYGDEGAVYSGDVDIKNPLIVEKSYDSSYISPERHKELTDKGYDSIINKENGEIVVLDKNIIKDFKQEGTTRYSKPEEGEERPRGLRWDKLEGRNNNYLKPLFKEMQKDIPEKNRQSWEETERLAEEMGMNYDKAKKLNRGPEVEEVEAVRMWAVGKGNLLEELGKKIQDGRATPREKDQYVIHLKQLVDIFDVFAEFSSKQGRGLNILRKVSINNKKAVNNVRYMLSRNGRDALDDDTRTKLLLDAVEDLQKNAGETLKRGHSKAYGFVMNALNLPRSIMSSLDFSAPLRQGVFLVGRKEFYKNLGRMFKAFGSERVYQEMMESIKSRPSYKMMKDSGLSVSDLDGNFTTREEAFMSQWAEKIPGLGKGIRASERAYSGFLNMLRADTFDTLVTKFKEANPESEFDEKRLKDLAGFINNATGRGKMLQELEAAAPMLNAIFFSPRLIASRVNLLNPAYYIKLDPMVRKEAVKSLLAFGTIAATIAGLFDANDDWNVETDPRSSDFMKLRTGNTRYDILGGFGQYITLGSRLATNETKTTLGEVKELGKQLGDKNRLDVLLTFLENKGSPVTTYVMDYLRGKNAIGEPFDQTWKIPATEVSPSFELRKAEISRFIPLFLQDAVSLMNEKGAAKGAAMVAPAVFGVGVQNYGDNNGGTALKDRYSSDPTVQEIQRLAGDKEIVSTGDRGDAKKYGLDKLSDEQIKQYRDYSAELIIAAAKEAMATEEWQQSTDEERKDWVSTIGKDMRELAREDLFGTPQEEETPEDEYNDE